MPVTGCKPLFCLDQVSALSNKKTTWVGLPGLCPPQHSFGRCYRVAHGSGVEVRMDYVSEHKWRAPDMRRRLTFKLPACASYKRVGEWARVSGRRALVWGQAGQVLLLLLSHSLIVQDQWLGLLSLSLPDLLGK